MRSRRTGSAWSRCRTLLGFHPRLRSTMPQYPTYHTFCLRAVPDYNDSLHTSNPHLKSCMRRRLPGRVPAHHRLPLLSHRRIAPRKCRVDPRSILVPCTTTTGSTQCLCHPSIMMRYHHLPTPSTSSLFIACADNRSHRRRRGSETNLRTPRTVHGRPCLQGLVRNYSREIYHSLTWARSESQKWVLATLI